ncbi:MAG: DsbA family oxidoreductase [Sphaerimonospora mesophila]
MAQQTLHVEFFHDVICSFCFPMSYRMRQIAEAMPNLEITHRSFALVKQESDFDRMFGSRDQAKDEIVTHWEQANQNDDLHRFNIDGMKQTDFPFPSSMKPLRAAKAALYVGGEAAYWDVFDALQAALFIQNQNIELDEVIRTAVKTTDVNFDEWQQLFASDETQQAVEADLARADEYGLRGVPALVINRQQVISGALPTEQLRQMLEDLSRQASEQKIVPGLCGPEGCI